MKSKYFPLVILFFSISLFTTSCTNKEETLEDNQLENKANDTLQQVKKEQEPEKEKRIEVSYHLDSLKSKEALDSLKNTYSKEERSLIFALNRIEEYRAKRGTTIVIPDSLGNDFLVYSPFPKRLPLLDSIPKAVLISQRVQGIGLYEAGELVRWGPVSSGKKSTPTPNGLHYGNYKAKRKVSSVNSSWILPYYFNFLNFEGVGVHQYNMPGFPASHACVRLKMDDAKYIYDWAEMWKLENDKITHNGTPFMVYGSYDYNASKPWLNLAEDFKADDLNEEELQTLKDYVKLYNEDPRNFKQKEEQEVEEPEQTS